MPTLPNPSTPPESGFVVHQDLWADHVAARRAIPPPVRNTPELTARERSAARTALWTAIKANDVEAVREALDAGADPGLYKAGDGMRHPPLHIAVRNANLAMVDLLLERGADPNQKSYHDASVGSLVVEVDDPTIAERLIAAGLRTGYPTVAVQDATDHGLLAPTLLMPMGMGSKAPRLKTWWLQRGGQGLPNTYWATLPLSAPAGPTPWGHHDRTAMHSSPWASWLHTAVEHHDENLAQTIRERVLGWSALESADRDPRAAWAPMLAGPWNDAVLKDSVENLEWLVAQRWTPATLLSEHGIAWAWTALTSNATNAYAWLVSVPGMAGQMRQDVMNHPELTLHRPLEKPTWDKQQHPFTGWTLPMLNRLQRAGVDVGRPNAQGDHLFHTALFAGEVTVQKTVADDAAHSGLVTWLCRYRPDLISVPNHEGLDLLAIGDQIFFQRSDWLRQRTQMEQAVLRGVAEEIAEEPLVVSRPRRRL